MRGGNRIHPWVLAWVAVLVGHAQEGWAQAPEVSSGGEGAVEEVAPVPMEQAPPVSVPGDPCDGITCSGVGTCVLTPSGPSCACGAGYRADPANGLACIPLRSAPAPVPRVAASAVEQRRILERALDRSLEAEFARFREKHPEDEQGPSFAAYLDKRYVNHRIGMAILTLPVTALLVACGVTMMAYATEGYYNSTTDRMEERVKNEPLYGVGALTVVVAAVTGITGTVFWARDDRHLRRIRKADLTVPVAQEHSRPRLAGVAPFTAPRLRGGGLALQFSF